MSLNHTEIDAGKLEAKDINSKLKSLIKDSGSDVKLFNPNSKHFLLAGLQGDLNIQIDGSAGYYLGTCMEGPKIEVKGNAGWYLGDNVTEGTITVEGSAGDGVGQGLYGGIVVVKKNCGSRTGQLMKSGTIIIGGDSGFMTGLYAFGGRIIVCGDLGHSAGESIIGGEIYVGGAVSSLGNNAVRKEVDQETQDEINNLLERFDLSSGSEFSKIMPARKRFYGLDMD